MAIEDHTSDLCRNKIKQYFVIPQDLITDYSGYTKKKRNQNSEAYLELSETSTMDLYLFLRK